jgi:beta-lactamase class A
MHRRLSTVKRLKRWGKQHWRKLLLYMGGGIAGMCVIVQLLYPGDRLIPFAQVDSVRMGGWTKQDAISQLNEKYKTQKINIIFGERTDPYRTPQPAVIGLTVDNKQRISETSYAWWLRLIPGSIFWAHAVIHYDAPSYLKNDKELLSYIEKELGHSCDVAPKNASLKPKGSTLELVPAEAGGTCKIEDVKKQLSNVTLHINQPTTVRIPMKKIPPEVSDAQARQVGEQVTNRIGKGLAMQAGGQQVVIDPKVLLGWLDFPIVDKQLTTIVNKDRANEFMTKQIAPKVTRSAGVSKVTTMDFVETARADGPSGQALNAAATLASMTQFLNGKTDKVQAVTQAVPPRIEYTRHYSPTDTGLSALMQQYAESKPGSFGISLIELSGQRRRASYQDTKQFQTASTYKLFIAYSTLRRIESGTWNWADQINGGRNLERCFDDMIVKSDNACAETLLQKISFGPLATDIKTLGLTNTSFKSDVPKTTSGDLAVFLATLESGQMFSQDSSSRLIGAMKRNIFRQGIPAGANGQVADKVGFINGLLHDAAIVYGPNGPAILCIMTDGSSWATIADLTRQIEALRAR